LDDDYLVLSTVHSAKGLEWDSVHVIHVVDGAFPADLALSTPTGLIEEQRLLYVALTRARDELAVYTPLRMPHHRRTYGDKHSYAPASRFLTDEVCAAFEIVDSTPIRRTLPVSGATRVVLPTLDELWA
jgi:DNA helicase-2/ATP-dependent DNA helicase PcrA